jgi:hypothetical protein
MSTLGISYTAQGGGVHNFVLDNFGDFAMPRSYQATATFEQSANGADILGGPAFRQKYQWVVSTVMSKASAAAFDLMFQAWDTDRAAGYSAACGVNDQTWGPTVTGNAVFVTPPTYTRMGPQLMMVSFGLQEV